MRTSFPSAGYLLEQYDLNNDHLQAIRNYGLSIKPNIENIVADFYNWLALTPDFSTFFSDPKILFHVKKQQSQYWVEFLDADISEEYVKRRSDVGKAHARIGLPVQPYFASMSFFVKKLSEPYLTKGNITEKELVTLQAISKLAQLDVSIAVDAKKRSIKVT